MKNYIEKLKHRYHIKDYKLTLIIPVLAISLIGIFMVRSAKPAYQNRQIMGVLIGIFVMLIISLIDYKWILNLYWLLYGVNFALLMAVQLVGVESNNSVRWLDLGFVQFQPSDLTKILMILFYARFLTKKENAVNDIRVLLAGIALILPSLVLIYKQPNLSNTICLALLFCMLLYLGGLSYKVIGGILAAVIPLGIILFILIIQPNQNIIEGYQQNRILAWLEPEKYESEEAYQQLQSIMAIGSGQLTGKGYNNTESISIKNGNFLSESQTDFIFAIIGEELGFVGCCAVIILLLLIVVNCILTGMRAKDAGGRIICGGVASLIAIQSFINISVATMLIPNTGISLPFVSYGLTSIVCFYMGIGLVLNVGLQPNKHQ